MKQFNWDDFTDYRSLLEDLRTRTGLWIGRQTISAFEGFLYGLWAAEELYRIPEKDKLTGFDFTAFQAWVDARHNRARNPKNTFTLARELAANEQEAFEKWFEWYDGFCAEQNQERESDDGQ